MDAILLPNKTWDCIKMNQDTSMYELRVENTDMEYPDVYKNGVHIGTQARYEPNINKPLFLVWKRLVPLKIFPQSIYQKNILS